MSKHTPGPWRLPAPREDYAGACVVRRDGFIVADCNIFGLGKNSPSESECEANALLIAAAPDLLAACEACAAWHWAEREVPKRLTTFDERMALCRYSEWMTLRALTVASGKSPDSEPYAGLLCVWTGRRPTSEQERVVVDRILCEYRAAIAKAEGGAA